MPVAGPCLAGRVQPSAVLFTLSVQAASHLLWTLAASPIEICACDFSDQMEIVNSNDLSGMIDNDGGRI